MAEVKKAPEHTFLYENTGFNIDWAKKHTEAEFVKEHKEHTGLNDAQLKEAYGLIKNPPKKEAEADQSNVPVVQIQK
jgi:hypothetical protein